MPSHAADALCLFVESADKSSQQKTYRYGSVPGTGKKTPGGAGTHTGHTGHTVARGHTDHTDEPHNHPPKPKRTQTRTKTYSKCTVSTVPVSDDPSPGRHELLQQRH